MRKVIKKLFAGVLCLAVAVSSFAGMSKSTQAAKTTEAYMMFSSEGNSYVYWHDGGDYSPIEMKKAVINGAGQYTVGMDFTKIPGGSSNKIQFLDFEVADGESLYPGYCLRIDELKINGKNVDFEQGYTTSDNGKDTRMNIVNPWAGVKDNPSARSYDKKLTSKKATLINADNWQKLETIEVTFTYARNMPEKVGSTFSSGAYKYKVTGNNEVGIIGLNNNGKKKAEIKIPADVIKNRVSYKITGVAAKACKNAKAKKLILSKNIKYIDKNAFEGCKNLTLVKCNSKLTSVGKNAFKGCGKLKISGSAASSNSKLIKKSGAKVE